MEKEKAIRKLEMIETHLGTDSSVPEATATSLTSLITCARNDMDNFAAYWGGISKVCSTLKNNPIRQGRLPDLPNEVMAAQAVVTAHSVDCGIAAFTAGAAFGSLELARGGQPYADADAYGKSLEKKHLRNTTKWYRNYLKGEKADPKIPQWNRTVNKHGVPTVVYPVIPEAEDAN